MNSLQCLLVALLCFNLNLQAQPVFYGVTGTDFNNGTLIRVDASGDKVTPAHVFAGEARNPAYYSSLMEASDGFLYGVTTNGGRYGWGTIFRYHPVSKIVEVVHNFDWKNGAIPTGVLIQSRNGLLYGVTQGLNNMQDVIYSFDPVTLKYEKLYNFGSEFNGHSPDAGLIEASNGKLYGTTKYQIGSDWGTVYSFDPVNNHYELIYLADFLGSNEQGSIFYGKLTEAGNGKLYGLAASGAIYEVDPATNRYSKLYQLTGMEGTNPTGHFTTAVDGKLYASAEGGLVGNGVIFSFDPGQHLYTKVSDTAVVIAFIHQDGKKIIGISDAGTESSISYFDLGNRTLVRLAKIASTTGIHPTNGLLQGSNSHWYGLTETGGSGESGILFDFNPTSNQFDAVYDFTPINGRSPAEGLVYGTDGKLYGTTSSGGENNAGIIFRFEEDQELFEKLFDFKQSVGTHPSGKLTPGKDNVFYGMTTSGGSNNCGVIYSFSTNNNVYTDLYSFDSIGGCSPQGNLVLAKNGLLYGMTELGGRKNLGVLFSFDPQYRQYKVLFDFDFRNGWHPKGSPIEGSDGKIYGMTEIGGLPVGYVTYGVIFSFDPLSEKFTRLYDFNGNDGGSPYGNLVEASDHKLYGVSSAGGKYGNGVIFSFDPSSLQYTRLYDFKDIDGTIPMGTLTQGSDLKLYGTTYYGGEENIGVVFSFDPLTKIYKKVDDFNYLNGAAPREGELIESNHCKKIEVKAGNTGPVCLGSSVQLFTDTGSTVKWSGPNGYYKEEKEPVILNVSEADTGIYTAIVTTSNGCVYNASTRVQLFPNPIPAVIKALGTTTVCEGNEVILFSDVNENIQWLRDGELINSENDTLILTTGGLYNVVVIDSNQCRSISNSIAVTVNDKPQKPTITWNGNVLSTMAGGSSYRWFLDGDLIPSATINTYRPVQNGSYHVEIINEFLCLASSNPYLLEAKSVTDLILSGAVIGFYPNPVRSTLYLHNKNQPGKRIRVQLISSEGRIVKDLYLSGSLSEISMQPYSAGTYSLVLSDDKEKRSTVIIVVK
jgi:uncharacterized repeat protein (TIGR03803 family)